MTGEPPKSLCKEDEALDDLMTFKEKWGKPYPSCIKSREDDRNMVLA